MTEAQERADLVEARANIAARIKEITASAKPTINIDGEMVDTAGYLRTLSKMRDAIQKDIDALDGPKMGITQGFTGS